MMRNIHLFVVTALFLANYLTAQNPIKTVRFGVKAGANFASVAGETFPDARSRMGFYAGLLAEIKVNTGFSVQPEIMYSSQGFSGKGSFLGTTDYVDYKMDYIQMPILAKLYLIDGLSAQMGPQIGFRINEGLETGGTAQFPTSTNFMNIAIVAGLEYIFGNGLFVQARYNYGLSKIYHGIDARNTVIQFGIGYFPFFEKECFCPY